MSIESAGKFELAEELAKKGETHQALQLLREVYSESDDPDFRMLAAWGIVLGIMSLSGEAPEFGTPEFMEFRSALIAFDEAFQVSSPEAQASVTEAPEYEGVRELVQFFTPVKLKVDASQAKWKAGDLDGAIRLLKEAIEETDNPRDRMFGAAMLCSMLTYNRPAPAPGTTHYNELRKYGRIMIELYDQASPQDKAELREDNDIEKFRVALSKMDQGKPIVADSRCFIATAAYGSPLAPEVIALRRYRDQVLLRSTLGRVFVWLYYKISPPVACLLARHAMLQAATRLLLISSHPETRNRRRSKGKRRTRVC